jgi:Tfp pilus assembly protein PilF
MIKSIVLAAVIALCSAWVGAQSVRADEVPMYGGMDRAAVPELKAGDEKLIADTTAHYGSRQKASAAFVDQGFRFYNQDQLGMAMRRFNQAWLLDPDNPQVYWGFGAVLSDQEKMCEAMKHFDKALSFSGYVTGMYPDAARTIALCGVADKTITDADRKRLYERADALYAEAAAKDLIKGYVYVSWATAKSFEEQYGEAWAMVKKGRETGGQFSPEFLRALRGKMREP